MKKLLILCFAILVLGGCNNNSLVFSGESKHWEGNYTAQINNNDESGGYTFHYKNGDSKTKFKNVEINIIKVDGRTSKSEENVGPTIKIQTSCTGCAVTRKDETMKVNIKWDNKHEENFTLKPDK
jgi:hypothetical protein